MLIASKRVSLLVRTRVRTRVKSFPVPGRTWEKGNPRVADVLVTRYFSPAIIENILSVFFFLRVLSKQVFSASRFESAIVSRYIAMKEQPPCTVSVTRILFKNMYTFSYIHRGNSGWINIYWALIYIAIYGENNDYCWLVEFYRILKFPIILFQKIVITLKL